MAARLTARLPVFKPGGLLLALPAILWLGGFFVLPLLIVLVISFTTRGSGGSVVLPLTVNNYLRVFDIYMPVIQRSLWVALLTTLICLIVGYPIAFFIRTRRNTFVKQFTLFLIILPFWTNFLVRIYAWRIILGPEGVINSALLNAGVVAEPLTLLNTQFSVLLGMVHAFLPFMVLPIYATVSKFDFRYLEAAHDLGANDWSAFWRVMLPMTLPGIIAGCILVFIPAIGTFVITDLLGGTQGIMIGNLIQDQYRGVGNLPMGAALSMVMMVLVIVALVLYVRFGDREARHG